MAGWALSIGPTTLGTLTSFFRLAMARAIAWATSAGSTVGTSFIPLVPAISSVFVKCGKTQVKSMPDGPNSTLAVSVMWRTAALLPQ